MWGISCDKHLGAVDFGLRRNDERAGTNCSLHTELAEGSAAVNLEHGVVRQAHHIRVKGELFQNGLPDMDGPI